ncbi:acylphosphatase [Aeromicrobium sp. NPDC092404]|uniref:acylphosphatase n=1 Tax=Aeromicrobium sp. NPDC092404 TaxID=3154976 RepID=UPI003441E179
MISRRVVVHGTVQGVFFRASCQREAAANGVAGWVSNRPDGSVEAVLEGDEAAVTAVVDWCRHGPPRAEVKDVEVSPEEPTGLSGFVVC